MPQIAPMYLHVQDPMGGSAYKAKCAVSVATDGLFSITLPFELIPIVEDILAKRDKAYLTVDTIHSKNTVKVQCRDLSVGKRLLEDAALAEMATDVKTELVICYTSSHELAYWKKGDGEIVPSGAQDQKGYDDRTGKWHGENNATHATTTFRVGLAARVYEKRTLTRKTGVEVKYARTYGDGDHWSYSTWLQKLNSFIGLTIPHPEELEQMPYTEEAAEFFFNAMLTMCTLSDRIKTFFGSPEHIQRAIASRSGLLLGAPKGE